jgi:polyhydroxybutyrate depolymerase
MGTLTALVIVAALSAEPLSPGDHRRQIRVDGRSRSYLVHVPETLPERAIPVVLVLHGARTNAAITVALTGMNRKADAAGFVAVYPNGTGNDPLLYWNAGQRSPSVVRENPDDVKFISALLDDLATVVNVDPKRVFATGMSNGGMMCYRLASELSDRIAAIAPVAGTMAFPEARPTRPVPVMHFHGTADQIVLYNGRNAGALSPLKSVDETVSHWRTLNGCPATARVSDVPDADPTDGATVCKTEYPPGPAGAEVVLYTIRGGGHTWPGQKSLLPLLGRSTLDVSANDLMWSFFEKHPLP